MERNIEHEVIAALAEKEINLTIETNKEGFNVCSIINPENFDSMEMHEFSGSTLRVALQQMLKDSAFVGAIGSDLFIRLNTKDEVVDQGEVIDTLSIMNPYLRELRNAFDKGLQSAAASVESDDTATVTAKVVIVQDDDAPEFANDAKMFRAAKFSVSVGIKREAAKYSGQTPEFLPRTVDGRMLLIDPDRQISLDEAIRQAETEIGNVPPEQDLMSDAPVDPQLAIEDYPEPEGDPNEDDDEDDDCEVVEY